MIGEVLRVERVDEDGHASVVIDLGGNNTATVELFAAPGEDSPPLGGDFAHCAPTGGTGALATTGFSDPKNAGKALSGEVRRYARSAEHEPVAELWLKSNGDVEIVSLRSGGVVRINGVEIDQRGNIRAPGEVVAHSTGAAVQLSTHVHPTAMGPSAPPHVSP